MTIITPCTGCGRPVRVTDGEYLSATCSDDACIAAQRDLDERLSEALENALRIARERESA